MKMTGLLMHAGSQHSLKEGIANTHRQLFAYILVLYLEKSAQVALKSES